MASRCCGNRLSLRNQYDTQTPRESSLFLWPWEAGFRAVRRLSRCVVETSSRHESNSQRGFQILRKFQNLARRKILGKIPSERPTAGLCLPTSSQSHCQRNIGAHQPQAVLMYRFLSGTRGNTGFQSLSGNSFIARRRSEKTSGKIRTERKIGRA